MNTKNIAAYGTENATTPLHPLNIERRTPGPNDILIEIMYCGICHSDLHAARNEWGGTRYPIVPGHEIVGRVIETGNAVTKYKTGDMAAIGCIVDSCRTCDYCKAGLEQFCEPGNTIVFGSIDKRYGGLTFGGFSSHIVIDESYAVHMPSNLNPAHAAPLLCAGITTYSPLKHWGAGPGKSVGVVGLGGLGHLAIKIAKAMGSRVVVFTTSAAKGEDAARLGADEVVLSTDAEAMKKKLNLDIIIDTVSANHNVNDYLYQLRVDGTLVMVGIPAEKLAVGAYNLIKGRKNFAGSNIGGIAETQEMLDFCAQHNIVADTEIITPNQINDAFDRLEKGDVRYRFVVDMAPLKSTTVQ